MKKWIAAFAAVAIVLGLFWLGGYNFDRRGDTAALAAVVALFFGAWSYGAVAFLESAQQGGRSDAN